METKFKKGDRVEVVDKQHPFFGWKGTVQKQIDHLWIRVDFDNGQCIDVHEGLILTTTAADSPRLASEMTLRERFDAAKEIYIELIQLGRPAGNDTAKVAAKAVHALIQALNEKP